MGLHSKNKNLKHKLNDHLKGWHSNYQNDSWLFNDLIKRSNQLWLKQLICCWKLFFKNYIFILKNYTIFKWNKKVMKPKMAKMVRFIIWFPLRNHKKKSHFNSPMESYIIYIIGKRMAIVVSNYTNCFLFLVCVIWHDREFNLIIMLS